jgi:ribonuclease Z
MPINELASPSAAISSAVPHESKLLISGYEVQGISIAGQQTSIIFPRLKLAFDSGRCPQRMVFSQTLLISHGHLDHVGGIPFHVSSRAMNGLTPSKIILPPVLAPGVVKLLETHRELQCLPPSGTHGDASEYEILPLGGSST